LRDTPMLHLQVFRRLNFGLDCNLDNSPRQATAQRIRFVSAVLLTSTEA
jgi:hypothetical protein